MNRMVHSASANRKNRVTSLVRPFVDLKLLATECEHLGHERHAIDTSVTVEGTQDFIFAAYLHPIADF
jgi:hypothetical protein